MYTVLLIEDQFDVGSMTRLVLSRHGYRALLAFTLVEANQIWSAFNTEIDLVLTDNHLPDGSGVAFAERLAAEKSSLKVIVSSGISFDNLPSGFLSVDKPFDTETLLKTLRRALGEPDASKAP